MLNPDAALLGPLTATRRLLRQPKVAAVSPLTLDDAGPGPERWDVATRRRTVTRALVSAAGYSVALRGTPFSYLYPRQPSEDHNIDGFVAGVCLAINRDAWNSIGGFDEEFFLYGEETDWQLRARDAGWRVLLADELGVDHRGEQGGHGPAVGPAERGRNYDLLRTNIALLLEHEYTVNHADVYLAATSVLDRVQRSKRQTHSRTRRRGDLPHIVITTNRLGISGRDRQKALLAMELDRRGYSVTVVCLRRFGPLVKDIPHSVRVVRQPWWAPMVDVPPGSAVVIGGDNTAEAGFATLWRATSRHRHWLVAAQASPEPDRPTYSRALTAALRRADGFITVSQQHWEVLNQRHQLGNRKFFAPNGVPISVPSSPDRSLGQPLHLVMLSRIVEHKNPQLLIEALAGLPEPPWRLSIFGDGPSAPSWRPRPRRASRSRALARRWPGPAPALADADLLCVPGRSEASPLVILEAMARGVPVAASAICAVPEMLDHGRAGFVVEPVTVQRWREELGRILAAPTRFPRWAVGDSTVRRPTTPSRRWQTHTFARSAACCETASGAMALAVDATAGPSTGRGPSKPRGRDIAGDIRPASRIRRRPRLRDGARSGFRTASTWPTSFTAWRRIRTYRPDVVVTELVRDPRWIAFAGRAPRVQLIHDDRPHGAAEQRPAYELAVFDRWGASSAATVVFSDYVARAVVHRRDVAGTRIHTMPLTSDLDPVLVPPPLQRPGDAISF